MAGLRMIWNDVLADQNVVLVDQNVVLVGQKPPRGAKCGDS